MTDTPVAKITAKRHDILHGILGTLLMVSGLLTWVMAAWAIHELGPAAIGVAFPMFFCGAVVIKVGFNVVTPHE